MGSHLEKEPGSKGDNVARDEVPLRVHLDGVKLCVELAKVEGSQDRDHDTVVGKVKVEALVGGKCFRILIQRRVLRRNGTSEVGALQSGHQLLAPANTLRTARGIGKPVVPAVMQI